MKLVTLSSGGIDSTLMSVLAVEQGFHILPLFVNYGQLGAQLEWKACQYNHAKHKLPKPRKLNVSGFGKVIQSGLTTTKLRIKEDAFLPGRNALLLMYAASYAYQNQCSNVAIGLLTDRYKLFPDQTREFINAAEYFITFQLGYGIKILTPLFDFNKAEVMQLSKSKKISKTYSCHSGKSLPCGKCISCLEIINANKQLKQL